MGSIVVGYILTAEGRAALDRAVEEARLRKARVVVVHSSRGGEHESAEEAVAVRRELEALEDRLLVEGVEYQVRDLVRGNTPAQDLVAAAREADADLIVIGLRRRSPVGKFILGSNAQEILLEAECAVLAVKAARH